MRVPPLTTSVLLLSIALGGVFPCFNAAFAEDPPRFAAPIPTITTISGATYRNVVVVTTGLDRFTFQHLGGTSSAGAPIVAGLASVPWTDLIDATRRRVTDTGFAEGDAGFGQTFPMITTIDGRTFRDVVVVAADPLRFTFRYLGGTTGGIGITTGVPIRAGAPNPPGVPIIRPGVQIPAGVVSLPWDELSLEIRKQFNFLRQGPERKNTIPRMQTSLGAVYNGVVVLRTTPDGLTFRFAGGTDRRGAPLLRGAAKLPFEQLPDAIRKEYGYKQALDLAFRPDIFTTSQGAVYANPTVIATDSRFLTFRHNGGRDRAGMAFVSGVARLPFDVLPDRVQQLYDYKQQGDLIYNPLVTPVLKTSKGTVCTDARVLQNDAVGLTFRHGGGRTSMGTPITPGIAKIPFTVLPDEFRVRYDYKAETAREFVRARTPAPPRRRFLLVTKGFVPSIASGRNTPALGNGGIAAPIGVKGITPAIGFRGGVPAIGFKGTVPAIGFPGTPPAIGGAMPTPAIGAGTGR